MSRDGWEQTLSELEDDVLMQMLSLSKKLDQYKKMLKALDQFLEALTYEQRDSLPRYELRILYDAVLEVQDVEMMDEK